MLASPFFIAAIEDLVNRVLRMDPNTLQHLGDFDGKIISLQLAVKNSESLEIYVLPFEGGLRLHFDTSRSPDVTILGNVPVFAHMLFGDVVTDIVGQADVQIRGDIKLGQRFREVLEQIEIDLEEYSSKYLGDVTAHRLGRIARDIKLWGAHARNTFKQDFSEYVQEEADLTPRKKNLDQFMRAVSDFQDDIDKVAQRVRHLQV